MNGKLFTEAEIATFHDLYPAGGSAAVHAALPHRSRNVIRVKAIRMGIACLMPEWKHNRDIRPYSAEDTEFVRTNVYGLGAAGVARVIGRTPNAVRQYANKLGIYLRKPPRKRRRRAANPNLRPYAGAER